MHSNATGPSCPQLSPYEARLGLENYLMPLFLSLTSLAGIVGNASVLAIILCQPGMRTVPNLLIANLAVADLVFICGHMWFSIPAYLLGQFYGGLQLCRLMVFVKLSTLGVSIFSLTFMAADRCRAITMPLQQHALSKISVVYIMVIIWVFSCAASIPSTVLTRVEDLIYQSNQTCTRLLLCMNDHKYFVISTWIRFCLYFVIPFVIISVCYIAISVTLCRSQNGPSLVVSNDASANVTTLHRQMSARKRLSVVVLALVAIFVICRLPYESHSIYLLVQKESIHLWVSAATIFLHLYSFINPLILYILSPTFRRLMVRMWCSRLMSPASSVPEHTMPISATQVLYSRGNRSPSP